MLRHLSILGFSLWAGFLFCARCFGGDSVRAPKDLLGAYLRNGDYAYDWELERSARDSGCTIHRLRLTSQRWRDRVWKHRLSVIVPDRVSHPGVLLFLSGEGARDGAPVRDGEPAEFWLASAARLAAGCEAVVALLGQVPNRSSADSLNAGAWIRRTLELAVEDGDDSWPLLFPMTKCVIRAMDAVTEFCAEMLGRKAGGFVVGGAAEQGWAVWLAASRDERISAISPWCA
ncbi:MAG: PhoPQ-activated protein PqaA family protein, partial [Alistipes ihumii]|nr:PhoPQ-activated protein PqaA family protein [Alistipes ihumii]